MSFGQSLLLNNKKFLEKLDKKILFIIFIIGFIFYLNVNSFLNENGKAFLRFITFGLPSLLFFLSIVAYELKYGMKENKLLLLIGNASYSIYLSHIITLHLYYKIFGVERGYSLVSDIISAILALIVGIIIYIVIEKRILNFNHKILRKIK